MYKKVNMVINIIILVFWRYIQEGDGEETNEYYNYMYTHSSVLKYMLKTNFGISIMSSLAH